MDKKNRHKSLTTSALSISISPNKNDTAREGYIILNASNQAVSDTVYIHQAPKTIVLISQTTFDVKPEGDVITVDIQSNIDFTTHIPDIYTNWIKESQTKAISSTTKTFTIASNNTFEDREGFIIVSALNDNLHRDTIHIIQKAESKTLLVTESYQQVSPEGGLLHIQLAKNIDYTIQNNAASWITHVADSPRNTNNLTFNISPLEPDTESRGAKIIFQSVNALKSDTLYICQAISTVNTAFVPSNKSLLDMLVNINIANTTHLAISGYLNRTDFNFIADNMPLLTYLDLSAANSEYIPEYALYSQTFQRSSIKHITLPIELKSIARYAFAKCNKLISITLSNGVTIIDDYAFENCTSLTAITIPASVKSIGAGAFHNCVNLENVIFAPHSQLYNIGDPFVYQWVGTFESCSKLNSITLPPSLYSLGNRSFLGCSLTTITIPDQVYALRRETFLANYELTSVKIGHNVSIIEQSTFAEAFALESINIPPLITTYDWIPFNSNSFIEINVDPNNSTFYSKDHVLYSKSKNMLLCYPRNKPNRTFTIPDETTRIETNAFFYCIHLQTLILPSSLISIGDNALHNCTKLDTIISNALHPPILGSNTSLQISTLYVTKSSIDTYRNASGWKNIPNIQAIPIK